MRLATWLVLRGTRLDAVRVDLVADRIVDSSEMLWRHMGGSEFVLFAADKFSIVVLDLGAAE